MNIEKNIFKRTNVIFNKLENYGFKKDKNNYVYIKEILNNNFEVIITIDNKGIVNGKIYDKSTNEEYTNIRTEMNGEFVNTVRKEYENILQDIKDNCFENKYFINQQTNEITKYINEKYNTNPEFLWKKYPFFGIFRNKNNNKWFALITNIDRSLIDKGNGEIELLNIKLDKDKINKLLEKEGFYKAYHMNKKSWISIILDKTVTNNEIFELINESYDIVNNKK